MNISQKFQKIISDLHNYNASDIHFQPFNNETKILYRMEGNLYDYETIETKYYLRLLNYVKYICNLDVSQTNKPQDGSLELKVNKLKVNIRISTIPLIKFESLVIRLIPSDISKSDNELIWQEEMYQQIVQNINLKPGLTIFTGPTGSGKTTLMYHVLRELANLYNKKIITIENPIEVNNDMFVQMQINEQKNLTYEIALKSVLRQDPDIIMIGEIRDEDVAKIVMRAALTGHSIITTMHTKNKYGVIERFLDFGFNESEIFSVLNSISNQRLVTHLNETKIFLDYLSIENRSQIKEIEYEKSTIEAEIEHFKCRTNKKEK